MADFTIRKCTRADVPELTRLWAETFGDSERLIREFFRLLSGMGVGLLAERQGALLGAAYAITGLELIAPDREKQPCGYLYAVAVKPEARRCGLGAALSRACADTAKELGCAFFCTQPAEPSLFVWYEKILSLGCALRRRQESVSSAALELCMELSPTDYRFWRERMLEELPHIRLGDAALLYQHSLCKCCGGGFYAVGDGVAAAYLDGDVCLVRELLCPEGTDRLALAASLAAQLGASRALLFTPDSLGAPYIAAENGTLPENTVWNLSFD